MEKDYLFESLDDIAGYLQRKYPNKNAYKLVLEAMLTVMSEDNLHEVVAAVSQLEDYNVGINFWYGDRNNFIDREFWR